RSTVPDQREMSRPPLAPSARGVRSRRLMSTWLAAIAVVFATAVPVVAGAGRHKVTPQTTAPTTFLVEGRVALTVPADWTAQRVIVGPGSARGQAPSPSDPEVALHVPQSVVPGETLPGTAQRMKRAIDSEPPGVFVDFNPS